MTHFSFSQPEYRNLAGQSLDHQNYHMFWKVWGSQVQIFTFQDFCPQAIRALNFTVVPKWSRSRLCTQYNQIHIPRQFQTPTKTAKASRIERYFSFSWTKTNHNIHPKLTGQWYKGKRCSISGVARRYGTLPKSSSEIIDVSGLGPRVCHKLVFKNKPFRVEALEEISRICDFKSSQLSEELIEGFASIEYLNPLSVQFESWLQRTRMTSRTVFSWISPLTDCPWCLLPHGCFKKLMISLYLLTKENIYSDLPHGV